ncbi:MAG TPA: mismatch-specific DNA-glycosylase [Acidimicrobiales bacterium]|nr:mismatch-specific DNA-glycosylase [Acidimicrobiales bacterium]
MPAPVKVTIEASGAALPLALADLHRSVEVGRNVRIERTAHVDEPSAPPWEALVHGGGFEATRSRGVYRRAHSLPDYVGPAMQLLLVGLNPSPYAADAGVGFARPGNRFWPAMVAAGLIDHANAREPRRLLVDHHIGMTDLVKRTTAKASEVDDVEFREGHARVTALVNWLAPAVVCFVGLGGWRIAADRRAVAGRQTQPMGSAIVYVMPNPSGLNAHATVDSLAEHFREVRRLARF